MRSLPFIIWILAAAMVVAVTAPSPALAARNKDTDMILAELRQLQAQVSQLQRAHGELERLLNQLVSRADSEQSSLRQTVVDTQTSLEDMKENISILSSRLDETNSRIGNLRREMVLLRQAQRPALVSPKAAPPSESGTEKSPPSGDKPKGEEPPALAAAAPSAVELYNQAYTDYTQLRYPLAVSGFEEVLQRYPESDLADNAQYWIGECYMAQRRYEEALRAFDAVLRNFPDSNKLPEASYKKATAFEALGRRDDAIQQLEYVIEQFAGKQVERNARALLKKLRRY